MASHLQIVLALFPRIGHILIAMQYDTYDLFFLCHKIQKILQIDRQPGYLLSSYRCEIDIPDRTPAPPIYRDR